eukprot:CAMPEP_0171113188 /NCGR_PEP_ID=MMETSP0766_2-20121228/81578_1 /TAXON_ID=439317 /ORGANISM="Gambierdiscus australes, Strain CAWD 149" /LENGTH=69 /DNA_ID=CAMNT_0011575373 /DNA_START=181 /DNA_END=390 /DNA_ORIENTATION=-
MFRKAVLICDWMSATSMSIPPPAMDVLIRFAVMSCTNCLNSSLSANSISGSTAASCTPAISSITFADSS